MTEHGWIALGLILLSVVAFLVGYIPSKRATNKERRQINAVKEVLRKTASPNWTRDSGYDTGQSRSLPNERVTQYL